MGCFDSKTDIYPYTIGPVGKRGNDAADANATSATADREDCLAQLGYAYPDRHAQYTAFIKLMHNIILQVQAAAAAAREVIAKRNRNPLLAAEHPAIYTRLNYNSMEVGSQCRMLPISTHDMKSSDKRILATLFAYPWAPAANNQQGITWIELLAIFVLHGGTPHGVGLGGSYEAQPIASFRFFCVHLLHMCEMLSQCTWIL